MNFEAIREEWDTKLSAIANSTNDKCCKRLAELVSKLKNITISRIIMGMGSWVLRGSDFIVIYDDGIEGVVGIQEIVYWLEGHLKYANEKLWRPKHITEPEIETLAELYHICEWLIDKTGGCDVESDFINKFTQTEMMTIDTVRERRITNG